jgi:hypothetical protein
MQPRNFEIGQIGRILHFESEIRSLRLDVGRHRSACQSNSRFWVFGFEVQDSSNFENLAIPQEASGGQGEEFARRNNPHCVFMVPA